MTHWASGKPSKPHNSINPRLTLNNYGLNAETRNIKPPSSTRCHVPLGPGPSNSKPLDPQLRSRGFKAMLCLPRAWNLNVGEEPICSWRGLGFKGLRWRLRCCRGWGLQGLGLRVFTGLRLGLQGLLDLNPIRTASRVLVLCTSLSRGLSWRNINEKTNLPPQEKQVGCLRCTNL